jgi:predicted transcriptional regulator
MKQAICLTLTPDVRQALDELAKREERSRSWVAERVLRAGLTARAHDATIAPTHAPAEPAEAA